MFLYTPKVSAASTSVAGNGEVKVMTFNVSHGPFPLNIDRNISIIADNIVENNIEVATIQEIPRDINFNGRLVSALGNRGYTFYASEVGYEIGLISVFSKYPITDVKIRPTGTGRVVYGFSVSKNGRKVNIVTTHLDPDGGTACSNGSMILPMYNSISQMYPNLDVILTGDLNVGPNWSCFLDNLITPGRFYETCDYNSSACGTTQNAEFCTVNWPEYQQWCSSGPVLKQDIGHLDFILAGRSYGVQSRNSYVLKDVKFSDHLPVVAIVKFANIPTTTPTPPGANHNCSVSYNANNKVVSLNSYSNAGGDRADVWFIKGSGEELPTTPSGTTLEGYPDINPTQFYYKLNNLFCSFGTGVNCSNSLNLAPLNLQPGGYTFFCQMDTLTPYCSGNPNITVNGGSIDVSGFSKCSSTHSVEVTVGGVTPTPTVPTPTPTTSKYDTNLDGKVDLFDALTVISYLFR